MQYRIHDFEKKKEEKHVYKSQWEKNRGPWGVGFQNMRSDGPVDHSKVIVQNMSTTKTTNNKLTVYSILFHIIQQRYFLMPQYIKVAVK